MSDAHSDDSEPVMISCHHGRRPAAVVCTHLLGREDSIVGFVENSSDPDDLQAWCSSCEAMFLLERSMTEAFLAYNRAGVVCDLCYQEIKRQHSVSPEGA